MSAGGIRNRITSYRVVKASELVPTPRAYRRHPERQRRIVGAYVKEVGWISPVVARRGGDGSLVIVDGALRASLHPEAMIPVVVTDLTEAEGSDALLMLDPTAELAEMDPGP